MKIRYEIIQVSSWFFGNSDKKRRCQICLNSDGTWVTNNSEISNVELYKIELNILRRLRFEKN